MDESSSTQIVVDSPTTTVTVVVPNDPPPPSFNSVGTQQLTPEEMVAKAIAPVKRQYLRPHPDIIDHGLGSFANSCTENTTTSKPNYTPFIGMQFETEEEAFNLYNNYGGAIGFSVKKHYRNKSKIDGVLTSRKFCCCKEGVKVPDKRDRETRKPRDETRTDCPAYMVISLNREINKFVVTKLETSHNHHLHLPECTYLMPSQRRIKMSSDDCGISLESSHELMSAQAGGRECLGFTPVDQNNYLQGKRQRDLKYGEVGFLLEYFQTQSAKNPAFYHKVQLDAFEQLTNFFWADPKMILDYANFGDVVSFDTTYRTNKEYRPFGCFVGFNQFRELVIFGAALLYDETTASFEWLLKTFFNAMSGKKPLTIFTDEDQAMAEAISIVMPDSFHGLCTWHLMQNALKHLGYLFKKGSDFCSDFNACIYKYKEESKLLEAWEKLLNDYKLHENTWIESKWQVKEKWAIAYMMKTFSAGIRSTQLSESLNSDLKDYLQPDHDIAKFLIQFERAVKDKRGKEIESEYGARQKLSRLEFKVPMLKQVAPIYTPSIFKKFQKQHTTFLSCIVKQTYEVGGEVQYVVGLYDHEEEYIVSTDSSKQMVFCGCRKFERVGILCSHALKVLDIMNIKLLPEHYILRRWTRDARTDFQQNANVVEDGDDPNLLVSSRYRELCPKLVQIASLGSEDDVAYQLVSQVTTDLCKELDKMAISRLAVGDCNDKGKSNIEDTCEDIDKFALVDPDLMRAKGLKKRDSGYKGWGRPKSWNEKSRKRKAAASKPTEPPKAKDDETPRSILWNTQGQNALAHAYTNSLSHSQPSNLSYGPSNMTYYPQQLTINDVQTTAIGSNPFFKTDNVFDFLGSEVNGLSKDVQKLLWKNNMKFPKADAKLKALGLLEKVDEEEVANQTVSNGSHTNDENGSKVASDTANIEEHSPKVPEVEDSVEGTFVTDEHRPSKKAKPVIDGNCCNGEVDMAVLEGDSEKSCTRTEVEVITDNVVTDADASLKLHPREKKLIDFREKLYLAPLTTVGNLPFRRVCKVLGADVTCGEMAMCTNLLQGQASEWALLRRHLSEDLFGVQICGAYPDTVARTVELIDQECTVDFIDINMGCPIDIVVNKGAGSALILKPMRMKNIIEAASSIVEKPITVKVRTGYLEGRNLVDSFIEDIGRWGASALTIHGRSRQQRYSKLADWEYIYQCTRKAPEALQVLGNGDVFSYLDWNKHKSGCPELSTCVIARGALVKPWIFTEIKEQRHWDISSGERLNILRDYVRCGLQHWGSDSKGVETTRHFLLEWLSYTYRYVPVGLLDVIPQRLNWRPPSYFGRDYLETLMASDSAADWVWISEMLLGKVPDGFNFAPNHNLNAYDKAENG